MIYPVREARRCSKYAQFGVNFKGVLLPRRENTQRTLFLMVVYLGV